VVLAQLEFLDIPRITTSSLEEFIFKRCIIH
jgi:hypothetical protein